MDPHREESFLLQVCKGMETPGNTWDHMAFSEHKSGSPLNANYCMFSWLMQSTGL